MARIQALFGLLITLGGLACARPLYMGPDSGTLPGSDATVAADSALPGTDGMVPGFDSALPGTDAMPPGTDATAPGTDAAPPANCGDNILDPGEQCDDGNLDPTDACTDVCQLAVCGDGIVRAGVEQCDDGNDGDQNDECLGGCIAAFCGDGFLWAGMEACDDANAIDGDACTNACTVATCGDGVVWTGMEECDDGNLLNGDGCDGLCALETCANPFGTDAFGYSGCWATPATLPCDDISVIGTNTGLTDDSHVYVPLGFSFDFYGTAYTSVAIGSNGNIAFEDAYLGLGNVCIPGTNLYTPQRLIAVFWDDLNPSSGSSTVRYASLGTAPARRFVVQWDTERFGSTPNRIMVRAVLFEGSNDIQVCYVDAAFGSSAYDYGLDATTGIQSDPSLGLEYSCNTATLVDGLLLTYLHP